MPFDRATLTQMRDDVLQDAADAAIYDTTTGQLALVSMFVHSPLRCVGYGTAGGVYSGYGYLDWIAEQSTPWGATDERAAGWGALKGVVQKAAAFAGGTETIAGAQKVDIAAGTTLSRPDGTLYVTTADANTGPAGSATIAFVAAAAGALGNAAPGTTLTFGNPIAGVNRSFATVNAITGGADIETPDAFKARYLQVYARPPAGGAQSDYIEWAEDVPGVSRAWCAPNGDGAGTVVVYTMWDVANAAFGGFPQGSNGVATAELRDAVAQGDQLSVADAIYPRRPVTALVYSCTPIPWPVNVTLANLGAANTPTILAAIDAALDAMFLRLGSPLGGAGAMIYPNAIDAAINGVAGVSTFTVVAPVAPLAPPPGYLPVLGAIAATS